MKLNSVSRVLLFSALFLVGVALGSEVEMSGGLSSEGDDDGELVDQVQDMEVLAAANPNAATLASAQQNRLLWLRLAQGRLQRLRDALASGAAGDKGTLAIVRSWWWLAPDQTPSIDDLDKAIGLIAKNRYHESSVTVYPDPPTLKCTGDPSPDTGTGGGFACGQKPGNTVYLRASWVTQTEVLRVSVLTHEYFHNIGMGHGGDPTGRVKCKQKQPMSQILDNADCMAGLVCALLENPGC